MQSFQFYIWQDNVFFSYTFVMLFFIYSRTLIIGMYCFLSRCMCVTRSWRPRRRTETMCCARFAPLWMRSPTWPADGLHPVTIPFSISLSSLTLCYLFSIVAGGRTPPGNSTLLYLSLFSYSLLLLRRGRRTDSTRQLNPSLYISLISLLLPSATSCATWPVDGLHAVTQPSSISYSSSLIFCYFSAWQADGGYPVTVPCLSPSHFAYLLLLLQCGRRTDPTC